MMCIGCGGRRPERRIWSGERLTTRSIGLLILNLLFLALTLKSRRFVEYWPVFAVIHAADLATVRARSVTGYRAWPMAAVVALLAVAGVVNLRYARVRIAPSYDPGALRGAMEYLERSTPAGSIVFTDDWDIFPYCFYWNHHNHYVVGLDPVFTMGPYPELWERYRLITRGQSPATLASGKRTTVADIGKEFAAEYVLVAADHPALYRQLRGDAAQFQLVYPPAGPLNGRKQPAFAVFEVTGAE